MAKAPHAFVSFPGGRYPNSCVKCGRHKNHSIHIVTSSVKKEKE